MDEQVAQYSHPESCLSQTIVETIVEYKSHFVTFQSRHLNTGKNVSYAYFVALDLGLVRTGCPDSLDLCLCLSPLFCHLQQIIWETRLGKRANPDPQKLNFL